MSSRNSAAFFSRKAVWRLTALLCAAVLFAAQAQAGWAAPSVTVNAVAGFNGYVKQGAWAPVRISLQNSGDGVEADVVLTSSDSENTSRSTQRVSLPRGSRRTITLYAAPGFTNLKVDVLSEGKPLASASPSARQLGEGDRLTLSVSDPLDGFNFLGDGRTPSGGRAYVSQARPEQVPDMASALDSVDVMVFNNVDTSQLSADQHSAIRAWLVGGGQLIVGGGPGAQLTFPGFADLLPAKADGALLNIKAPRAAMAEFARPNLVVLTPTAALTTAVVAGDEVLGPASQLRIVADDAVVLMSAAAESTAGAAATGGDYPLALRRELGRGVVDQLAFDPSLGAWADTNEARRGFFAALTGGRYDTLSQFGALKGETFAWAAARSMPVSALPPVPLIAGFLALYVAAIGPLNYWLLKRFNRPQWAWFTVPAMIAAFTLVGASVGVRVRGNEPRMNRLSVLVGDARVQDARAHLIGGIFTPRRATFDIALSGSVAEGVRAASNSTRPPLLLQVGPPNFLAKINVDNNDVRGFFARGDAAPTRVAADLTFEPGFGNVPARIIGGIRNLGPTPLKDCVLVVGRDYQAIGDILPDGEVGAPVLAEARLKLGMPQSTLNAAGRAALSSSSPYRQFNTSRNGFGSAPRQSQTPSATSSRNSPFDLAGAPAFNALIGWRAQPDRFGADAEQNLVQALYDETTRVGDGANLMCWEYTDHTGASMPGATFVDRGARVWRVPVHNLLVQPGIELPPDVFAWRVANSSSTVQFIGDGLTLDPGRHVIAFTPWFNVRTSAITNTLKLNIEPSLNSTSAMRRGTNALVYDWEAKDYRLATTNGLSSTTQLKLVGPFVSPTGEVRLKLETGASGLTLNNLGLSVEAGN